MFFSWMVSSSAVARDFRSEMDCGVTGKLQPFSSDCSSSFTAHTKQGDADAPKRAHADGKPSLKPTLFRGENSRQRAAVGFHKGFRVFPTLQGTLKSAQSESEHHRKQTVSLKIPVKPTPDVSETNKCAATLYLPMFDFSKRTSSWSWLNCWCKYLKGNKH